MEISWGFFAVLILILFPGVIIRKLYFYGEFSKQFTAGISFVKLLSISSIPGLINLIVIYFVYDSVISEIDLGAVIDTFKDVGSSNFKFEESTETPIKERLNDKVFPFLGFLYLFAVIVGSISGRLVRITRLDTRFKLLKFKNYWFYLFNNEHTKFKKMRYLKEPNSKHLFTIADVLIDSNNKTNLYSGIIVDYELLEGDSQVLSKLMLRDAERYSEKDGIRVPVKIPGNLLVVDCHSMKNINLTFVCEKTEGFLKSKWPSIVDLIFSLLIISLIPFFIFRTDYIEWNIYLNYFKLVWYEKVIFYFLTVQVLSLFNPFVKNNEKEYKYVGIWELVAKAAIIVVLVVLVWLL
jgi:hypothetical protein